VVHHTRTLAVACLLSLGIAQYASAQVNATVGGTVTDSTGGVMPKVEVTAKNNSTGIVTTRTTNETGAYTFPSLQPGSYSLSATAPGFQTQTFNNVELGQNQQVRMNFTLQVSAAGQTVEVVAEADTQLATTSSSVGGVLPDREVQSLPVATRNVLDLVTLTPGVVTQVNAFGATVPEFAGTPTSAVNTTRDGMVTNDGRYNNGAYSAIFTSPDLVEEVRISTNSIDPSLGRGSAQVQMRTRAGGNDFHGALFYTNNNSDFNALNYFQNLQGQKKDYQNRNQFGGRLGGPIKKNKAFFFVLFDDQRYVERVNVVSTVLTATARQGIFRYLTAGAPGGTARRNGNAFSATPSVDLNGNILTSANGQQLYLNQFNLFSDVKDPNRTGIDPVWFGPQYLARMPLPNNWTVGDGLNTAGFQWQRRDYGVDGATGQSQNPNRNHMTLRFDYQINDANKVNFIMSRERDWGVTGQTGLPDYPAGYFGDVQRVPRFYTAQWTSTLSPTLLNEFRFGYKRDTWQGTSPIDLGCCWNGAGMTDLAPSAQEAVKSFPTLNGKMQYVQPDTSPAGLALGLYAGMNVSSPRQTISPFWQIADTVSWNKGNHSFQGGFEINRSNSSSANSGGAQTTRPSITLGVGTIPVQGITTAAFAGITPNDVTTAQNLLANLAGSIASITQQYFVNSPNQTSWSDYRDGYLFYRDNHYNQWAAFFKDTWKVSRDFTINLGLRYDFYGTPYEAHGLGGKFKGGGAGLFGISGTDFASAWTNRWSPNLSLLTTTQFTGPNSPNPGETVYNNDWNNVAPSIGFSWSVPHLKRSTVIRGGYGINYLGTVDFLTLNTNIGNLPGQTLNTTASISTYTSLQNLASRNLIPINTGGALPFSAVPLTNRTAGIVGYDTGLRTPYLQTFNFTIQREITHTLTFDVSYIGNKATKLLTNRQINDVDVIDNGFLNAFNITRAGGNAPLFDQMFNGLNVTGVGIVGQNGLTGSEALRRFTSTNAFIANGQVGALANYINTTAALTGTPGGILRNGKLPENFIVVNPQFGSVAMVSNNGNSTYHSLQAHVAQRYSHGLSGQFSYTFSKNLGDNVIRDQNNLSLSKGLLNTDRTHVIQENVTYELPFGKRGQMFTHVPTAVDHVIGGWQLSSGMSWTSGQPLTVQGLNTLNQYGGTGGTVAATGTATADLVGNLPAGAAQVVKGNGYVTYFPTLTTKAAPVPNFGADQSILAGRFTNQIVVDQNGNTIFQNAQPGVTGNTSAYFLRGPGQLSFNGAASKLIRVTERITVTLRADAINLLNKPQWGSLSATAPAINTNINSTLFGRITSATGNRTITFNARVDF
jgi:hypothetical protein